MSLSRRGFLKSAAAAGAATAAGLGATRAWATSSPGLPILEIYCVGGFFHWLVGRPSGFAGGNPDWLSLNPGPNWTSIAASDPFLPSTVGTWPTTTQGIDWGEAAAPLIRSNLDARTRYVAVGHEVEAHQPAAVHALTGSKLGRARATSLGTAINHAMSQSQGDGIYSITLETAYNPNTFESRAASAFGLWGAQYAPVTVPVYSPSVLGDFIATLGRPGRTATDGVKALYRDRYNTALTHAADGRVRSASFDAYTGSLDQLFDHTALAGLLSAVAPLQGITTMGYRDNPTRNAIRYAVDLLRQTPLRHIALLDHGMNGDYDTHNDRAPDQAAGNLWSVLRALAEIHQGQPLSDVLVVLHSEFSRIEYDGDQAGTEHWPWATACFFFGGPVRAGLAGGYELDLDQSLPHVEGYLDELPYTTPTDLRAVCAWAAGIPDPLNPADPYFDRDLALTALAEEQASNVSSADAIETIATNVLGL